MRGIHNHQKKIVAINDFSGFGRCSLTVSIPLISYLGIQCCPVPTAILSNHTGFDSYFFHDYTDNMESYVLEWKKLGLVFDGILTGFLGSEKQIQIVNHILDSFVLPETAVIVDPVMGDYGRPYATCTPALCEGMKKLAARGNMLTPNLTEACMLTGNIYRNDFSEQAIWDMAKQLCEMGSKQVVITGIVRGHSIENYCYDADKGSFIVSTKCQSVQRSGTGDVFSSIVAAGVVLGIDFEHNVSVAADFINKCLKRTEELDIPKTDGLCFEEVIQKLHF